MDFLPYKGARFQLHNTSSKPLLIYYCDSRKNLLVGIVVLSLGTPYCKTFAKNSVKAFWYKINQLPNN
jgi:hypothetical protein